MWRLGDAWERFADWAGRKLCGHKRNPAYREVMTHSGFGGRSWSAFFECPDCGEVLGVEASFYGDPLLVKRAVDAEVEKR